MQPESERPEIPGPGQENPATIPVAAESTPSTPAAPPSKPKIWGAWPTIGLGAAVFIINSSVQVIVAIVFAATALLSGYSSGQILDVQQFVTELSTNGLMLSIALITSAIVGVGFIILFIKVRKGASLREYLALTAIRKRSYLVLLAIAIGLILLSAVVDQFFAQPQDAGFTIEAYQTSVWPVLFWTAVVIFAPLFEESFFRGFLFTGLVNSRLGAVGTIALTSLAWAALHVQYNLYGITTILVLGIFLGIVRLKTRSLWSTLFLHALWNLIAMIGTVLTINGV